MTGVTGLVVVEHGDPHEQPVLHGKVLALAGVHVPDDFKRPIAVLPFGAAQEIRSAARIFTLDANLR